MLELEVVKTELIEGGIAVFARVFQDGVQIGFGADGTLTEAKWYDKDEDLCAVSKKYQDTAIYLTWDGEEKGDIGRKKFVNGEVVAEYYLTDVSKMLDAHLPIDRDEYEGPPNASLLDATEEEKRALVVHLQKIRAN